MKNIIDFKKKFNGYCAHEFKEGSTAGYFHTKGTPCEKCHELVYMVVISLKFKPNFFQIILGRVVGLRWKDGEFEGHHFFYF